MPPPIPALDALMRRRILLDHAPTEYEFTSLLSLERVAPG